MREFYFRHSGVGGTTVGTILAIVIVAVGALSMMVSNGGGGGIGLGLLFLVVNIARLSRPMITLHDDHLVMKIGVLARRHEILYDEITAIREPGPKRVILVTRDQQIVVPLVAIEPREQPELVQELKRRATRAATGSATT